MSGATNTPGYFSLVTSSAPKYVGKRYFLGADGKLTKKGVASIFAGKAVTIEATAENLVSALKQAARSRNQVILLDHFIGVLPGAPDEIDIVVKKELERLIGGSVDAPAPGVAGYFAIDGRNVSARLNLLMTRSGWVLFDGNSPEDMPNLPHGAHSIESVGVRKSERV